MDPNLKIALVVAVSSLVGALVPYLIARIRARQDGDTARVAADTELRVGELQAMAEFRKDLMETADRLTKQVEQLETENARLHEENRQLHIEVGRLSGRIAVLEEVVRKAADVGGVGVDPELEDG